MKNITVPFLNMFCLWGLFQLYTQECKTGGDTWKSLTSAVEVVTTRKASGAVHSYSEPEVRAFSQYVNENLAADPDCKKYLPLEGEDIFTKINDGVLLMLVDTSQKQKN